MLTLSGYRILERLHDGDKSLIYRASTDRYPSSVILKVLRAPQPSPHEVARLKREYAIVGRFNHPGIIRPLELTLHDSRWVMVLEDLPGRALDHHLAHRTRGEGETALELESFFDIALQLCDALEVIHNGKVIHKDIKPSNLVWSPEKRRLQVIDFGIASELHQELPGIQSPHVLEGTLHYMSPEQTGRVNRVLDHRSDFYSVGATFYELLSGHKLFDATEAMELVHCQIARTPDWSLPVFAQLPAPLIALQQRLLAKDAEERYQTIHGLRKDLELCRSLVRAPERQAAIAIGSRDSAGVFHIPQKLYGREQEIEALLAAFTRVSGGPCELLLVGGYSGIGKTAVINEVHKPIVARRGYFVSGKFDQYKRNIPYSALIQGFQDLIRQLLTEPKEKLAQWAERLRSALGANAGVIAELIPELHLIIGATAPVAELLPLDAQNRLHWMFQRFVQVFSAREHPLVVFLDDLQWADQPTLKLLELFMNEPEKRYVFFIGAYRDNEVDADHPLMALRENLLKRGMAVHTLTLAPLREEHVTALISDTLGMPAHEGSDSYLPLAHLCFERTRGNPFFLNQFLRSVHEAGFLTYDFRGDHWTWDIAALEHAGFTHNVVELMIRKIRRLPEVTQRLLQLAASMGNRFELDTLAMVSEQAPYPTQQQLWPALEADLIRPLDNRYKYLAEDAPLSQIGYRFLHDRVQQAAYALATDEERQRNHLTIGRLLLRGTGNLEEQLFTLVEQLNSGRALITERAERLQLAQLNHRAGLKARGSAAYQASARHMQLGISVLPEDAWQSAFPLTLDLHIAAAEAAYLSGDFATAEAIYPVVIPHCTSVLEKVRTFTVQVSQYQLQGRFAAAISIQREGLRLLGIDIPESDEALKQMMSQGFTDIEARCAGRTMADILAAPSMEGAERLAAMQLLCAMWYSSYLAGFPVLNAVTTLVMTRLSLEYGNSDLASFAYVNYAFIVTFLLKKYDVGYAFGAMAIQLASSRTHLAIRGSTYFLFATFTNHWNNPLYTSDQYYDAAYGWSLESGDFPTVGYIIAVRSSDRVIQGRNLPELLEDCQRDIILLKRTGQIDMVDCTLVGAVQAIKNLMGRTHRHDTYDDDGFSEQKFLSEYDDKPLHLAYFFHGKIRNAYLFDTPQAEALADKLCVVEQYVPSQCKIPEATFYAGLIWARALRRRARTEDTQALQEKFSALRERMRAWAAQCHANFGAKHLLLEAQAAQVQGDIPSAMRLYRQAIDAASETRYLNLEALANELCGEFWLEQGQPRVAEVFLRDAHYLFQSWGAYGKVSQLEEHYPGVQWVVVVERTGQGETSSVASTTGNPRVEALDLTSMLKATHALSSEVGLGSVLKKLLKIARENSGAQTVRLVLQAGEEWRLEGDASGDDVEVLQSRPVSLDASESELFPLSLLRYVIRTGQELVHDNIGNSSGFSADPYVSVNRPKAVMCLPIKRFSKVAGIIYLENNLVAGAFILERVEFLRVLAAQAVISIDNARLYESLEHKVEERTRELLAKNEELGLTLTKLRDTQRQLVAQEKLASLGGLTAGIAHELKNPLNFVNNFAELSIGLADDVSKSLGPHRGSIATDELAELDDTLDALRDNARRIREHGKRASQILDGMLMHSRGSSGTREPTDLNAILNDAVNLAYHAVRSKDPGFQVNIQTEYAQSLGPVEVVALDISRVLINLLNNAYHALQQKKRARGSAFVPQLLVRTVDRGERVEVSVRDNGIGIPSAIRSNVWNPFFTTKSPGEGTGLGLSISHDIIVGGHGGEMRVDSVEGEFTEFVFALPKRAASPS